MNLLKTTGLTFVATAIRMLSGLIINKAIALFIGPSGLALIGQFQNSTALIKIFGQAGINNGVVKYTAEYDEQQRTILWSTSLWITLIFSTIAGIILIFGSKYWAQYTFHDLSFSYIYTLLGATLILFSLNQLLLSILNGLKEVSTFISIQISMSLYSLVCTTLLIYLYQLDGILIAIVTNQLVGLVITLWKLRKHKEFIIKRFIEPLQTKQCKILFKYSLMTLVTCISMPLSQLVLRDYIAKELSWDYAGYWQAMNYISNTYLLVITTAISTYFLPRLSEIKDKTELKQELIKGYGIIIPIVIVLALGIFILKNFIVWLLFTPDFMPMLELMKWRLIGDVIAIATGLLVSLMMAKAMIKKFIIMRITFSMTFVLLSILFFEQFGFVGLSYAFALNGLIHFMYMTIVMSKYILGRE